MCIRVIVGVVCIQDSFTLCRGAMGAAASERVFISSFARVIEFEKLSHLTQVIKELKVEGRIAISLSVISNESGILCCFKAPSPLL